jgi:hypothetical protein
VEASHLFKGKAQSYHGLPAPCAIGQFRHKPQPQFNKRMTESKNPQEGESIGD